MKGTIWMECVLNIDHYYSVKAKLDSKIIAKSTLWRRKKMEGDKFVCFKTNKEKKP